MIKDLVMNNIASIVISILVGTGLALLALVMIMSSCSFERVC